MITTAAILNHVERFIHSKKVWVLFFLFSFIIYSPFFIHGLVIVSTTDSVFNHYPNLLFGLEHLREGQIPLWNPYLFGGIDFTTSMHHHILNPANWILALFPKEYALYALTFIEFVEIVFVGLFSFKTFQLLQDSRIISFASAVVVQLSGFTWFTTSTFIGVEFFFLSILFIYLIISFEKRRPIVNFIFMALLSAGMFLEGHVGYIAAFFFPIILVQIIRHHRKLWQIRGNPNLIFALACLFGLGMGLFRIYPILATPVENVVSFLPPINFSSNGYKLLSGLIPAVFGVDLGTSTTFFQQLKMDGHIQFHSLLYFGLPTAFFFLMSLRSRFSQSLSALSWMTFLVILGSLLIFQPAVDLIYFIFYPFVHDVIPRVGGAFLIFAIFYFSIGKFHEKKLQISEKDLRMILVFGGMTLCFTITFFFHLNISAGSLSSLGTYLIRFVIAFLFIFTIWSGIKFPIELSIIKSFNNWLILVVTAAFFLFSGNFIYFCDHSEAPSLFHFAVLVWSLSLLLLVRKAKLNRFYTILLGLSVLLLLYIAIIQNTEEYQHVSKSVDFIYPLMGVLTFIVAFLALWEIFAHLHYGRISHRTFLLVITLFLVGDLIFYLKIYSYSGAAPFLKKEQLYPEVSRCRLDKFSPVLENNVDEASCIIQNENKQLYIPDFKNYRVNYPGNYFVYPWGSAFSSAFVNYHVRTIGGIDSIIHLSFLNYLGKFVIMGLPYYGRGMVFPGINNLRLEEVFGIRYSFPTTEEIRINENALSRFSAFSNFVVMSSPEEMTHFLIGGDFRVSETVILDRHPDGFQAKPPKKATKLEYETVGTDQISLYLNQETPHIILFNDTFNEGWTATWNGEEVPILLANGRFMAVSIPAGLGTLEFNFRPKMFFLLVKVSLVLGAFLLALGIYAFFSKSKEKS